MQSGSQSFILHVWCSVSTACSYTHLQLSLRNRGTVRDWERETPRVPQACYMRIKEWVSVCACVGVTDATRGGSKALRWWDGQRDRNSSHCSGISADKSSDTPTGCLRPWTRSWPRPLSAFVRHLERKCFGYIILISWNFTLSEDFVYAKLDNSRMLLMIVRCYGALIGCCCAYGRGQSVSTCLGLGGVCAGRSGKYSGKCSAPPPAPLRKILK